jgi:exosome complex RNA-binding protein Csl4
LQSEAQENSGSTKPASAGSHLENMNQRKTSVDEADSLGSEDLFDEPKGPPPAKRLLAAALKAREDAYAVDVKIDVRVLSVNAENKKCVVTAKKSMVKADDSEIVTSYDDLKVGKQAVGFIFRVDERSVFVSFCNRVYGRVTAKSLTTDLAIEDHTETYHVGDVVKCRVVKMKKRKSFGKRSVEDEMDVDGSDSWNVSCVLNSARKRHKG